MKLKPSTMSKFATVAFVLFCGGAHPIQRTAAKTLVSPLGGVNLLDYHIEVNAADACAAPDGNGPTMPFTKGAALVYPSLLAKIKKVVGPRNVNSAALEAVRQVQTLHFMESSARHVDNSMDAETGKVSQWLKKDDVVGMIFGNTNEGAYFETDEGELCVPVVEGVFLAFDGSIPHRTVMKSGHINLIGPFILSSDALATGSAVAKGDHTPAPTAAPTAAKSGKSPKSGKGQKAPKSASAFVSTTTNASYIDAQKLAYQQHNYKSIGLYAFFGVAAVAAVAVALVNFGGDEVDDDEQHDDTEIIIDDHVLSQI
eukprot:scaffold1185_cov106-Skeletonema_dohrnii-CCMP3373.AAC.1